MPEQLKDWFGNDRPCHVEIGCGYGEWIVRQASLWPELNFVAMEYQRKRVLATLRQVAHSGVENVRVVSGDAAFAFENVIPDDTIAAVHLNFPDPWPKVKHQKNRIVQPPFMSLVSQKLAINGRWHSVTDDQALNEHMMEVLQGEPHLEPELPSPHYTTRIPDDYKGTVFGTLWDELGREKYYMSWRKAGRRPAVN